MVMVYWAVIIFSLSRHLYTFHSSLIVRVLSLAVSCIHLILTSQEIRSECIILIDNGTDSCVSGKHGDVLEFIDEKEVNTSSWEGYKTNRLRTTYIVYPYENQRGTLLFLSLIK